METEKLLGHSEVQESSLDDNHMGASLVASPSLLLQQLSLNQPIHCPEVDVPLLELAMGLMHMLAQAQEQVVPLLALVVGLKQMLSQA